MRSHGVKNFPDPQISGNSVSIKLNQGAIDNNSPVFQNAQKACQHFMQQGLGGGRKADPTKVAGWAACMRAHGLPHFPDPKINSDGAMQMNMTGTGLDPNSTTFQNAMKACQPVSPGGGFEIRSGDGGGH
jgi:hypothetical protein